MSDEFNEARWRRAGADDLQVDALRNAFAQMTPEQRVAENQRVASRSDGDLAFEAATFAVPPSEVGDANVPVEVTSITPDDVGDDAGDA